MIVFDLRCGDGHVFEIWFRSSDDYADQRARGLIACPVCGGTEVDKAVMAPRVAAKGNRAPMASPKAAPSPDLPGIPREVLAAVATMQAKLLEKSQWVGTAFADTARAIHLGEEPERPIHGQATLADARALAEEGVSVAPLLVPVVPPDALH
ncbi:MAG: DUF1178 family protein [Sphingomonas sp.]